MQDHGNGFQPCCYLSKVLNTAESHYPTFEQELLALKKGMEQWRHYLLLIRFLACTDHNGLKYLKTQPNLSERQWHWIAFFSEYNFDIEYHAHSKMQVPDALNSNTIPLQVLVLICHLYYVSLIEKQITCLRSRLIKIVKFY